MKFRYKPYENVTKAVNLIIDDISDRRGLRQEWEQIDPQTQQEIKDEFRRIIIKSCFTEPLMKE